MTQSLGKITFCVIFLGILPLCFGGAHHITWYLACAAALILTALTLQLSPADEPAKTYKLFSKLEWSIFALFAIISSISLTWHAVQSFEHPVLGLIYPQANLTGLTGFLSTLILLLTPLFIFSVNDGKFLRKALQLSALATALIALTQWFSDNGLLLWVFAPQYIFESTRARWPFVNPNHLGAFLLIPTLLSVDQLLTWGIPTVRDFIRNTKKRSRSSAPFPLLAALCALFTITGILAAQSRLAWGACAIGMLAVLTSKIINAEMRRKEKFAVVALSFICALGLGWGLMLSERVASLVGDRFDLARATTLEDVRFEYATDANKLFKRAPLLGIGPGGFARDISSVARPSLAGLNPVYLHNDVWQFFIEYGLFAGICLLALMLTVMLGFSGANAVITVCCVVVLLLCLLDFPFRIGALVAQFGVLLALGKTSRTKSLSK